MKNIFIALFFSLLISSAWAGDIGNGLNNPGSGSSGTGPTTNPVTPAQGGTGTSTVFTQGSVVFAGASGVYSQDNAQFFWDDTNHRLGIGTSTPSTTLDVMVGSGNDLQVSQPNTGVVGLRAPNSLRFTAATGNVAFLNGSTENLTVSPTGVGITSSVPAAKLDVNGGTVTTAIPAEQIVQTWNNVAITFNGLLMNITNTASATASQLINLEVAGASKFSVNVSGSTIVAGGMSHARRTIADAGTAFTATDYEVAHTTITAARVDTVACTLGTATTPQFFIDKDESGSAGITNTITVTPSSGTIDGAANKAINSAFGVLRFYSDGTNCFTW